MSINYGKGIPAPYLWIDDENFISTGFTSSYLLDANRANYIRVAQTSTGSVITYEWFWDEGGQNLLQKDIISYQPTKISLNDTDFLSYTSSIMYTGLNTQVRNTSHYSHSNVTTGGTGSVVLYDWYNDPFGSQLITQDSGANFVPSSSSPYTDVKSQYVKVKLERFSGSNEIIFVNSDKTQEDLTETKGRFVRIYIDDFSGSALFDFVKKQI